MIFRENFCHPQSLLPDQDDLGRPLIRHTPAILAVTFGIFLYNLPITGHAAINANQFAEVKDSLGVPVIDSPGETWGVAWGDLDADGYPDAWLGMHQYTPSALFRNNRDGSFSNVIGSAVVNAAAHYRDDTHGVAWADFDNDGDDDLLEVCGGGAGKAANATTIQEEWRNNLFVNSGGLLSERARALGIDHPRPRSRTPLWMDFDDDGALDVVGAALQDKSTQPPSYIFRQVSGAFTDAGLTTGFDPGSCHFAMTSHLGPNGEPAVLCGDTDRITRVYSTASLPFTDLRPTLGNDIFATRLYDIAIGDFNGDLVPDVFGGITAPSIPTAIRIGPGNDRIHAFIPGATEQGFSFSAPGDVQVEFGWETTRSDIFLGGAAVPPPSDSDTTGWLGADRYPHRVKLTLSKTNPSHIGLPATRSAGVYIGYTGTVWEVRVIKPTTGAVNLSARAVGISSPAAIGAVNLNQGVMATPALFLNQGGALVRRGTADTFLDPESAIRTYARSLVAGDFDNDMDLDVFVGSSGKVANVQNLLFENLGNATFRLVANAGGASGNLLGRTDSATLVDFDQDGFLDLFVSQGKFGAPFSYAAQQQLFRNSRNNNHWILIDLEGVTSNRDGVGAVVHARTPDGKKQMREQNNGVHRYVQDYAQIHFGLAGNQSVDVDVFWPSGVVDTFTGLEKDRIYRLVEGSGGSGDTYSLSMANVTATENSGVATFTVVLSRAPGTGQQVKVNYQTANRSALAGTDYSAVSGVLTFGAGEVKKSVSVPIIDDAVTEGWEAFALTLSSTVAETVTAKASIRDNDTGAITPLCGKPNYDKAIESAVLLWNDCGTNVWHVRGTGGGQTLTYQGTLSSTQALSELVAFSMESGDVLPPPNFTFNVAGTTQDGFDISLPPGATACFDVNAPATGRTLVGSNRVAVNTGLSLPGYGTCTPL